MRILHNSFPIAGDSFELTVQFRAQLRLRYYDSMKLVQWNASYTEDPLELARQIGQWQADIVCLQEITRGYAGRGDAAALIADTLGMNFVVAYRNSILPAAEWAQMGCAILSRYPIVSQREVSLNPDDAGRGLERVYVEAMIDVSDELVAVGTAHLLFHPRFITSPHKAAMVERLANAFPTDGRRIFAGDLNATPGSWAAKRLRRGMRHAGPTLAQPTWTTQPVTIGPYYYRELKYRLDYVLYDGDLRVQDATCLASELSDHNPLLVELALTQSRS